jgi:hypothetical protein
MASSAYELDPNNFLGNRYNTYISKLTAYAIRKPDEYITLRETVINEVKSKQIDLLYKNFFALLKNGKMTVETGGALKSVIPTELGSPSYPDQDINQFVLSIVDKYNAILDELLDILIPDKVNNVLGNTIGKANI